MTVGPLCRLIFKTIKSEKHYITYRQLPLPVSEGTLTPAVPLTLDIVHLSYLTLGVREVDGTHLQDPNSLINHGCIMGSLKPMFEVTITERIRVYLFVCN